jgi:hypothetical protein
MGPLSDLSGNKFFCLGLLTGNKFGIKLAAAAGELGNKTCDRIIKHDHTICLELHHIFLNMRSRETRLRNLLGSTSNFPTRKTSSHRYTSSSYQTTLLAKYCSLNPPPPPKKNTAASFTPPTVMILQCAGGNTFEFENQSRTQDGRHHSKPNSGLQL